MLLSKTLTEPLCPVLASTLCSTDLNVVGRVQKTVLRCLRTVLCSEKVKNLVYLLLADGCNVISLLSVYVASSDITWGTGTWRQNYG